MSKLLFYTSLLILFVACTNQPEADSELAVTPIVDNRIPVLNMGTFHFGYTTDANTVDFDEHSDANRKAAHAIAAEIGRFKPTWLALENQPQNDSSLQAAYAAYLANPDTVFAHPNEIHLLAFEIGRLANVPVEQVVGIDHKMNYQYRFDSDEENIIDSVLYHAFYENPIKYYSGITLNTDTLDLRESLLMHNDDRFLDVLITANADALTLFGTPEDRFQGTDQAARYYQRNLRMFANLNALPVGPEDRVFVLSGASHAAFFRDFLSRSYKYRPVDIFDYFQ